MKKHHALQLYDYHVWANNKFFVRLKELPKDIYDREIQSVFSSIAETLVHIYTVDTIWLGVIRENSMDEIQASIIQAQEKTKDKGLEEMETLFYDLSKKYQDFFNNESDLDKEIFPEHPQYGRLETYLSELVQHVVNHGTYHRGNLMAMIRQQGYSSVPTDYVFYLYEISSTK
ncbi:DinB family protein (plasmid) [Pseudalkalibacillus hwajinpoensis]|uniref:DinB family protein n=1 Tax=Guptibacillus hwajinpoensis TaxID=208199 RepID=UPI00325BDA4D